MTRLVRLLSLTAALLSLLMVVDLQKRTSGVLAWPLKVGATALAPLLALLGAAGALFGVKQRDPVTIGAGLAGATVFSQYIVRVAQRQPCFDEAFGSGWEARLPAKQSATFLRRRYAPLAITPRVADWQKDIVYGVHPETGRPLLADLWQPRPGVTRSGLGVIYVHGGAWRVGQKGMATRPFFRRLASQGHVVMDIEYTLAPAATIPAMLADVKRAIIWLKEHAPDLDVNPQRIVLVGSSAGGHLALLAAYTPNDPAFQPDGSQADTSVRAVVSFYGPTDFLDLYRDVEVGRARLISRGRYGPYKRIVELVLQSAGLLSARLTTEQAANFVADLLGAEPDEQPDLYCQLSPSGHVGPHCPPTLLVQGASDIFGMAPSVRRLHQALRQVGVLSILVEFPATDHAFDLVLPQVSPVAQAATYDVERFLALMV